MSNQQEANRQVQVERLKIMQRTVDEIDSEPGISESWRRILRDGWVEDIRQIQQEINEEGARG